MIEVFLLALIMSIDAFIVSIVLGSTNSPKKRFGLVLLASTYFGVFHALMPFVGYWGGKQIFDWIEPLAKWVAFALLIFVAGKMLYEVCSKKQDELILAITHKTMIVLAFATSLDAIAVGFSLNLMLLDPLLVCIIIGLTAASFSAVGVLLARVLSHQTSKRFGKSINVLGALVLSAIAIKLLWF